ncbi:hypothetical protein BC939DRAFT_498101 [Gamsiella multidivaricata]|uniref:uncharacterized protein n=1 Tax=Gamsiella multidivaricata TaxID=101098 RepID=UPI00221F931C|nr:uncharacterized protein BC939DRAFT_498101 [Gamsiella multidivaricata]KAI7832701.1 hypothetical protein BC939DRAFT_498101 [Gamsiella multidivaricata]
MSDPGGHFKTLWTVFARLEVLELESTEFDLSMPQRRINGADATAKRLPRLQELSLRGINTHPRRQLELLIRQCPVLRTLYWRFHKSLVLDTNHRELLQSSPRPLRRLEVEHYTVSLETFDVLRTRHFATLEFVDLLYSTERHERWAIEVLNFCPGLKKTTARIITAQDILNSRPWACKGLQKWQICIDMEFRDNGPFRRFTVEELQLCRAVYKRLAIFKQLQVLDMLATFYQACTSYDSGSPRRLRHLLVPLPMRLRAGLDLLAGLTNLKEVGFWGGRYEVCMKELVWMVERWKRLKRLGGGCLLAIYEDSYDKYLLSRKLSEWLNQRGITTDKSYHLLILAEEPGYDGFEDCCGFSGDEDEPGEDLGQL